MKEQIEEKNTEKKASFWYRAQEFIQKNQKILIICGSVIVVVVGFICLRAFVLTPNAQHKAAEEAYSAQYNYGLGVNGNNPETLTKGLEGDGKNIGLKKVYDKYSANLWHGTPALANTSLYYAGIASLRLGKYDDAIKYLEEYDAEDYYTPAIKLMAEADAYVEKGDNKKAIELYVKAAETNPNDMTSGFAVFKAGMCCLMLNDNAGALKHFNTIKEKYPQSVEYSTIDYFIGIAEAK